MVLGWGLSVTHLVIGLVFCLTIIRIPFGKQHFKFAKLALVPFGTEYIQKLDLRGLPIDWYHGGTFNPIITDTC